MCYFFLRSSTSQVLSQALRRLHWGLLPHVKANKGGHASHHREAFPQGSAFHSLGSQIMVSTVLLGEEE